LDSSNVSDEDVKPPPKKAATTKAKPKAKTEAKMEVDEDSDDDSELAHRVPWARG
jgi:hypothetical protein